MAVANLTINRWPHRAAWLLACGTFPLILMGGMVTSYGAGLAVPDWPNTYGYNLFLYPLASWLHVWDVFLEHSHRLIGASVGMITIALAVLLWACDRRRWIRWLGVAALVGVCYQGVLGGLRVTRKSLLLADVHGCTAPLFFALCVGLVVVTSVRWQAADRPEPHPARGVRGGWRLRPCGRSICRSCWARRSGTFRPRPGHSGSRSGSGRTWCWRWCWWPAWRRWSCWFDICPREKGAGAVAASFPLVPYRFVPRSQPPFPARRCSVAGRGCCWACWECSSVWGWPFG